MFYTKCLLQVGLKKAVGDLEFWSYRPAASKWIHYLCISLIVALEKWSDWKNMFFNVDLILKSQMALSPDRCCMLFSHDTKWNYRSVCAVY